MIRSISIKNYKSLVGIDIKNLKKINLITGKNAGGKTSLLEALFLLTGAGSAGLVMTLNVFRGDYVFTPQSDRIFSNFFSNGDFSKSIEISCSTDEKYKQKRKNQEQGVIRTLSITPIKTPHAIPGSTTSDIALSGLKFVHNGPSGSFTSSIQMNQVQTAQMAMQLPGVQMASPLQISPEQPIDSIYGTFITPYNRDALIYAYTQLVQITKNKRIGELIDLVKIIDDRIINVIPINENGQNIIYVDVGSQKLLPATGIGSGFIHILSLSLAALDTKEGVLFVDEIEDGIHYSIFSDIAKLLINIAQKKNIQFFVSTHSSEFLRAFNEAATSCDFQDVELLRLSRHSSKRVISFDHEEMAVAMNLDGELR